jgi:hypothetical protein
MAKEEKVMNRLQKMSWFNIIVIISTIIITTTGIMVELEIKGYSDNCLWFFVIPLLLLRLKPFLFKKPQGRDKVVLDERDFDITKKALAIAYKIFWYVFIALSFLLFLIIGPRNSVPAITLPLIAIGSALFIQVACSAAILVQYGRGGKDG